MWDYTDKVKEHFFNPKNVGVIENPDGIGEVGSLACGDALKLMFNVDENERITDVKFQTFGCGSAIASSSALTEMLKDKTLVEAEKITNQDIADYLGGLPDQKMHCSVMGHEALQAAIENYRSDGTIKSKVDVEVACTCFGVTVNEIETVTRQNNLKTVEEVTNYCKAGGGCGGCHDDIKKIISRVQAELKPDQEPQEADTKKTKPLTNIQKIKLIEKTLDEHVRPTLQADGGDLELIDVINNKVVIAFRGMCAQCHVSEFTMAQVVEKRLREFVSEDIIVEEQGKKENEAV